MLSKKEKIEMSIRDLSLQFSDGDPIAVYGNPFHAAALMSEHRTLRGAATAIVNYHHGSDCMCGGAIAKPN